MRASARLPTLRRRQTAATADSRWPRPTTTPPASAICWTRRSSPPTRCTRISATRNPPFSGGERDAINCVQLYRVTHDKKHLDLAKHYLDIRGLPNSVNRSRHNQSYKPVLEQTRSRRSRRELRVADGVARRRRRVDRDQGILRRRSSDVARCRRAEDVHHRRRRLDRQRRIRRAVFAAEHLGLLRDMRGADVHHAEPPNVPGDRRQQVHRRHGTRHVQQRHRRRVASRATASST